MKAMQTNKSFENYCLLTFNTFVNKFSSKFIVDQEKTSLLGLPGIDYYNHDVVVRMWGWVLEEPGPNSDSAMEELDDLRPVTLSAQSSSQGGCEDKQKMRNPTPTVWSL